MAAIALAESGGNPNAHNPSGATGLWQILGNPFPGNAFDPMTNAKMAVAKEKSQGLNAWVTFTSGAYKQFLKKGVAPAGGGGGGSSSSATTTSTSGGGVGWSIWSGIGTALGQLVPGLGFITSVGSDLGSVAGGVAEIHNDFVWLMTKLELLFSPSFWVRVICFGLGVPLVGIGVHTMTKGTPPGQQLVQGAGVPLPTVQYGSLAPAVGIAEVTVGAILLFFAFHNTQSLGIQSFTDLMSFVQARAQEGVKLTSAPKTQVI